MQQGTDHLHIVCKKKKKKKKEKQCVGSGVNVLQTLAC